jgi:hypothetical protein
MVHFIKEDSTAVRCGILVAIYENYAIKLKPALIEHITGVMPEIAAAFNLITSAFGKQPANEEVIQVFSDVQNQAFVDDFLERATDMVGSNPCAPVYKENPPALQEAQKYMHLLRPLVGILSMLAIGFGFDAALTNLACADTFKRMKDLAASITATKTINGFVNDGIDSVMSAIFEMFGGVYLNEKTMRIHKIMLGFDTLERKVRADVEATRLNPLLLMNDDPIGELTLQVEAHAKTLATLSVEERSLFNFAGMLHNIRDGLKDLRDRRISLCKQQNHKIEPVAVWLFGDRGVGKSRIMSQLGAKLGTTTYVRTSTDHYWPNYKGQTTCCFDDIGQYVGGESSDIQDWHKYFGPIPGDVIGAAIEDKGTPFTSRYMIATANFAYLTSAHTALIAPDAFHRRRHYLVHVVNNHVERYKELHNGEEPTASFFHEHPTELRLYSATTPATFPAYPTVNTVGFVGRCTVDQLAEMMRARGNYFLGQFRDSTIANGTADQFGLRNRVFPDRPELYDTSLIFNPFTKERYDNQAQRLAMVDGTNSSESSISVNSGYSVSPRHGKYLNCALVAFDKIGLTNAFLEALEEANIPLIRGMVSHDFAASVLRCAKSMVGLYVLHEGVTWVAYDPEDPSEKIDMIQSPLPTGNYIFLDKEHYTYVPLEQLISPIADVVNQVQLAPVNEVQFKTRKAVVFVGAPGVGKSTTIRSVLEGMFDTYAEFESMEEYKSGRYDGKALYFDDISLSTNTIGDFKEILRDYNEASRKCGIFALIASANSGVPAYSGPTRLLIERRCHIINVRVSLSHRDNFKVLAKMQTLHNICEKASDRWRTKHITYEIHPGWCVNPSVLAPHIADMLGVVDTKVRVNHEPFGLPMPVNFDYLVDCDIDPEAIDGIPNLFELRDNVTAFSHDNGVFKKMSLLSMASEFATFLPFFKSQAFGFPEEFVAGFNKEEHKNLPRDVTVIIQTKMGTFGFSSCVEEKRSVCFMVDHYAADVMVKNGILYQRGEPVQVEEPNRLYLNCALKLLGKNYVPYVDENGRTIAGTCGDIRTTVIKQHPLTTFAHAAYSAVSLFAKAGAAFVLIGSLRKSKDEPIVQLEYNKGAYQYPGDSSAGTSVASSVHSRKTTDKSGASTTSSPGSKVGAQPPSNRVHIEANKRGAYAYPGDSTDCSTSSEPSRKTAKTGSSTTSSPSFKTAGNPQQNRVMIEALSYDGTLSPVPEDIEIDDFLNPDGTIVRNEQGKFGVIYAGQIYYAAENCTGMFDILVVPITKLWTEDTVPAFPVNVTIADTGTPFKLKLSLTGMDAHSLRAIVSQSYGFSPTCDFDFSSIFAYVYAVGIPLDINALKVYPYLMPKMFTAEMRTRPPTPLRAFLSRAFPRICVKLPIKSVDFQGMVNVEMDVCLDNVTPNLGEIIFNDVHVVNVIMIKARLGVTVGHLPYDDFYVRIRGADWSARVVARGKYCDLSVIEITDKTFAFAADISTQFVRAENLRAILAKQMNGLPGMIATIRSNKGSIYIKQQICVIDAEKIATSELVDGHTGRYSARLGHLGTSGVSRQGFCGAPLFLGTSSSQGHICGIHKTGNSNGSYCTYVTREFIDDLMNDPSSLVAKRCTPDPNVHEFATSPQQEIPLDTIVNEAVPLKAPASVLKLLPVASVCTRTGLLRVGELPRPIYCPKSTRIKRTGFQISHLFDIARVEPSVLSHTDPRSTVTSPLYAALKRYGEANTTATLDQQELNEAADYIGDYISNAILASDRRVRVLTKTEAINILDRDEYPKSRPIDRDGSSGFPHNYMSSRGTRKGDFLIFNNNSQKWYFNNKMSEAEAISKKIDLVIHDAQRGVPHLHPCTAYLKDELLKTTKIYEATKTRMFFSYSFEYLVAYRMYFMSAMQRMTELFSSLPIKVGISPTMEDWHHMVSKHEAMGPDGFTSDVAAFDSGVPREFLKASGRVFGQIYSRCSQDGEDRVTGNLVRRVLHDAVEGAYVLSGADLFKLIQAQVSGNPSTAPENSIIIWLLYYLVWRKLALKFSYTPDVDATFSKFMKCVCLSVYGDDNMCTVAPGFDWFNFNTFAEEARNYGFVITSASKTDGPVPNRIPLTEMEFLKRDNIKINGFWAGRLQLTSLCKSFEWVRGDGAYNITPEVVPSLGGEWPMSTNIDIISQSVDSCWSDLALHGELTYSKVRDELLRQSGKLGISLTPPSWRDALALIGYPV